MSPPAGAGLRGDADLESGMIVVRRREVGRAAGDQVDGNIHDGDGDDAVVAFGLA